MSKIVRQIFSETTFKIVMLIILMFMLVPYFQHNYGWIVKLGLVVGAVVCIDNLVKNKLLFIKDAICDALCLFVISYAISILTNRGYFLGNNIKELIYMVTFVFVFFIALQNESNPRIDITTISIVIVVLSYILSLASLITFLFGINITYQLPENGTNGQIILNDYYIGLAAGRLYGVTNANAGASLCLISIILSVYLLLKFKNANSNLILKRTFLIISILLQYTCLLLTQARSAEISGLIVLFFGLSIYLTKQHKGENRLVKMLRGIFLSCFFVLLIYVMSFLLLKVSPFLPSFMNGMLENSNMVVTNMNFMSNGPSFLSIDFEEPLKQRAVLDSDILTGRLDIWKSGFEIFKESPMFGLTREGFVMPVYEKIYSSTGIYNSAVITGGLHNIYLTVLVSSGIVGFLLMSFVIISVLYKSFYVLFKEKEINIEMYFALLVSMAFLLMELVESRILYQANVFNVIYWIYFGYLYYFVNTKILLLKNKRDMINLE